MASSRLDSPSKKSGAKVHIMPHRRKASRSGSSSASIDLARPSFDQEGLGIFSTYEKDGVQSNIFSNLPTNKRLSDPHRRSTSGTSQFSTVSNSSMTKPGGQYIHPMRLAPRAYTPPLTQSCHGSFFESDDSTKEEVAEGVCLNQSSSDVIDTYARTPRLSLQIQNTSFTRLPGASQTNIASRSSFGYSRDNGSTLDTTSPISRTSLDFVFRSKTRTSMDPLSRAATVQAARQAFEEKEAAKIRKLEQQQMKAEEKQMKAEEKQMKRKEKQDHRASLREDEIREKGQGKETSKIHSITSPPASVSQPGHKSDNWKSQSSNSWLGFLTWLRTRLFKFRRRVRRLS